MRAVTLARDVVSYAHSKGSPLSNLKLQKTLYYIQGYCLKESNTPAFTDKIQHWGYGPVVPSVYYEYSVNGADAIQPDDDYSGFPFAGLDYNMAANIKQVIDECMKKSASTLVRMTHQEKPWMDTSQGETIQVEAIWDFFNVNDPLNLHAHHSRS